MSKLRKSPLFVTLLAILILNLIQCNGKIIESINLDSTEMNLLENIKRCRTKCLFKFSVFDYDAEEDNFAERCRTVPNCAMCWDYCHMLEFANTQMANLMCSDTAICFKGCKVACRYHKVKVMFKSANYHLDNLV